MSDNSTHKIINGNNVKSFEYNQFEHGIYFVEENITIKSSNGLLIKEEK
jgi:hypothetical protein